MDDVPNIDALETEVKNGIEKGVINPTFLRKFVRSELNGIAPLSKPRFLRKFKPPKGVARCAISFWSESGEWFVLALPRYDGTDLLEAAALYRRNKVTDVAQEEIRKVILSISMLLQAEIGGA